jgi:hypothetical protein
MVRAENLEFSPRMGFSTEYLRHCAQVELARAIGRAVEA